MSNSNEDEEKQVSTPEQPQGDEAAESTRKRRRIGLALVALAALAVIIGLSVGLTRPKEDANSSSATLGEGDKEEPTTSTNNDPKNPTSSALKFESKGKAFDVKMNVLSPAVLEGYSNGEELRTDLDQSVRFFINNFIEEQLRYQRDYAFPEFDMDESDSSGFIDEGMSGESDSMADDFTSAGGATDFETNNQEEGVDEADFVKSDGTYVYAAYGDVLVVWEALTGDFVVNYTLPALATTDQGGDGDNFPRPEIRDIMDGDSMYYTSTPKASIRGISLEGGRLVLYIEGYGEEVKKQMGGEFACYDAFSTRLVVLDITSLPVLSVVTQKDIQGSFRDARCIGSKCHVVASCNFNFWSLTGNINMWNFQQDGQKLNDTEYRELAATTVEPEIEKYVGLMYDAITAHVEDGSIPSMPKISLWQSTLGTSEDVVAAVNTGGAIQAFLGLISFDLIAGDVLEVGSAGVCTPSSWGFTTAIRSEVDDDDGVLLFAAQGWDFIPSLNGTGETTYLMGFGLDGTTASPALIGSLPGYVQSERSIGIFNGHIRVATTINTWWSDWEDDVIDIMPVEFDGGIGDGGEPLLEDEVDTPVGETAVMWPRPRNLVQNQVVILKIPTAAGETLEEVARIPDLGEEGETIRSVRYFGDVGYAVTFNQTDPFYVLDLNPSSASVLGELKITGFSSYLHSINADNTLIVGVGEEADEGGTILGLQVSLFDASDPANPQLRNKATVETDLDTWSSSDVSFDFKAFRYVALGEETGIVILPVRVESWDQGATGNFDGFYVFDVSRDGGVALRMKISHVESEEFFGGCYSPTARLAQRSMVFNGNVTTMKGHSIVSTDLDTTEQRWKMDLSSDNPNPDDKNGYRCVCW